MPNVRHVVLISVVDPSLAKMTVQLASPTLLTTDSVQEKFTKMQLDDVTRNSASRALRTIRRSDKDIEVIDRNVRLVPALQAILPHGKRVTPKLFNSFNMAVVEHRQSVEELVYLVRKALHPGFGDDAEVAPLLYTGTEIDFPPNINPN